MCGEILNPKLLFLKCKLQWFAHFPSKCIYQYLNMISFASRNVFSATNWKAEKNGIPPWDSIIVLELDASKKRTPSIVVTRLRKQPPPQFAIFSIPPMSNCLTHLGGSSSPSWNSKRRFDIRIGFTCCCGSCFHRKFEKTEKCRAYTPGKKHISQLWNWKIIFWTQC